MMRTAWGAVLKEVDGAGFTVGAQFAMLDAKGAR
jgi:hypothetical protein